MILLRAATAASFLALACGAAAQTYPSKPLLFVTPFPPGPGPDLYLRPLLMKVGEQIGQTIVIETKLGASGAIAMQFVVRAAPDGHTLGLTTNATLIQTHVDPAMTPDSLTQVAHISRVTLNGSVLVVSAASPVRNVEELVAMAKASPGKLNYGSGGIATPSHLGGATLDAVAGLSTVHVPYKNSADVVPGLIRGDLQFAFQVASFAAPHVSAGKLRVIGVTAGARMRQYPDVPTLSESLKSDLMVQESWLGLALPVKTPAPIVQRLHAETLKAIKDPLVQAGAERGANNLAPSKSPAEYLEFIRRENEKWGEIVRLSGVKPR
ncbi:MAG: tripartite tricarboxylate transporter substrate binding protein [Burkholderiales bacterium]|nr:tripartite tricarboxylate transporter substrate binding protein [Burkholderiales bacterium]